MVRITQIHTKKHGFQPHLLWEWLAYTYMDGGRDFTDNTDNVPHDTIKQLIRTHHDAFRTWCATHMQNPSKQALREWATICKNLFMLLKSDEFTDIMDSITDDWLVSIEKTEWLRYHDDYFLTHTKYPYRYQLQDTDLGMHASNHDAILYYLTNTLNGVRQHRIYPYDSGLYQIENHMYYTKRYEWFITHAMTQDQREWLYQQTLNDTKKVRLFWYIKPMLTPYMYADTNKDKHILQELNSIRTHFEHEKQTLEQRLHNNHTVYMNKLAHILNVYFDEKTFWYNAATNEIHVPTSLNPSDVQKCNQWIDEYTAART